MKYNRNRRLPFLPYRVLDLTDETGVFCTKILAGLGADVLRIEPPGGHPTRKLGPFIHDEADPEKSLHWFTYNLNKRSITLNIESAGGQVLLKRLAHTADFLVESFPPGYLDGLGLGYSVLRDIRPGIVFTSITPFGSTGPYSQHKSSHLICSAASGYMYLCGDEDRPPVQVTVPVAYVETGLHAAAGTLMAHWHRQRTGEGQHVDVSAQESFMSQVLPRTLAWKSHGLIAHRGSEGAVIPGRPSYMAIMECVDGLIVTATTVARGRRALRDWLDSEGMAGDLTEHNWDPVFLEGKPVTVEQKNHIDDLFRAFAAKRTREELMTGAQKRRIQVAKLQNVREVIEDPHLRERQYFCQIEQPEHGEAVLCPGAPFKSDEMAWEYDRRAPFIGEHNHEIYVEEMGFTQRELDVLKKDGVI